VHLRKKSLWRFKGSLRCGDRRLFENLSQSLWPSHKAHQDNRNLPSLPKPNGGLREKRGNPEISQPGDL
jgi:hypothetical protein